MRGGGRNSPGERRGRSSPGERIRSSLGEGGGRSSPGEGGRSSAGDDSPDGSSRKLWKGRPGSELGVSPKLPGSADIGSPVTERVDMVVVEIGEVKGEGGGKEAGEAPGDVEAPQDEDEEEKDREEVGGGEERSASRSDSFTTAASSLSIQDICKICHCGSEVG